MTAPRPTPAQRAILCAMDSVAQPAFFVEDLCMLLAGRYHAGTLARSLVLMERAGWVGSVRSGLDPLARTHYAITASGRAAWRASQRYQQLDMWSAD